MPDLTIASKTLAIIFLSGFAIQQTLEILDTFVISRTIKGLEKNGAVLGVATADFKKGLMLALSSALGILAAAALAPIALLSFALTEPPNRIFDIIVSGLVIGSGTEATNIALKYFGYLKDAQKEAVITLSVTPNPVSIAKGQTVQFFATVGGGTDNKSVEWKVVQGNGGSINDTGLYSAPGVTGTFQVVARCKANPAVLTTVPVTVTP